nr:ATP-binding protein [Kibdelosporangium sp. MJ126-NF4]
MANRLRTVLESVQVSLSQQAILHWIKNDVAALRLQVDHIRPSVDQLPPDVREVWRLLSATLDRLAEAHNVSQDDIRDLLVPKQFDLRGMLQELVIAEDRYQRIAKVSLEDESGSMAVEASHLLVTSALRNLLTNALQAIADQSGGPEGQVKVTLRVVTATGADGQRRWAQVGIADSGPGFSEELRTKFARGERFSNRNGGEGNGLRFARAQLSYCGGDLTLLPGAGSLGGAQLQVRLPLVTVR